MNTRKSCLAVKQSESKGRTERTALDKFAFISAMIIPYFTLKRLDIIQNIKENR